MKKENKKLSKTKISLIISILLFIGWIGFSFIPSVSVSLGGGCGFFFFIMIIATIIIFIKEPRENSLKTTENKQEINQNKSVTCKICKYCGSENQKVINVQETLKNNKIILFNWKETDYYVQFTKYQI